MSTQQAASTRAPTGADLLLGGATVLVAVVAHVLLHALLTDTSGMPGELWPLGIVGFLAFAGWARLL